jgi:hypothetical protein
MSEKDDGGSAFPIASTPFQDLGNGNYTLASEGSDGMTLRDYFAAHALQGLLAYGGMTTARDRAVDAYQYADGMLAARKR